MPARGRPDAHARSPHHLSWRPAMALARQSRRAHERRSSRRRPLSPAGGSRTSVPTYQVDSFTDKPFAGNSAAVYLLDAPGREEWMQKVAAEMNLSETAFVQPHASGAGPEAAPPLRNPTCAGRIREGLPRGALKRTRRARARALDRRLCAIRLPAAPTSRLRLPNGEPPREPSPNGECSPSSFRTARPPRSSSDRCRPASGSPLLLGGEPTGRPVLRRRSPRRMLLASARREGGVRERGAGSHPRSPPEVELHALMLYSGE